VRLGAGLRAKVQSGKVSLNTAVKRSFKKAPTSKKQRTRRAAFKSGRQAR
jgi:hypothetical protein